MSDDLIIDLVKEVRNTQQEHTMVLHDLRTNVQTNTEDLAEHIEGVMQNRVRIEKLEIPLLQKITLKVVGKTILGLGGLSFAIMGIWKLVIMYNGV